MSFLPERRVGLAKSLLPSPKKHHFSTSLQHSSIQTCPVSDGNKRPNAPASESSDVLKRWRARHGLPGSDADPPSTSKCSVQVGVIHVHDVSTSQCESHGFSSLANSELTRRLGATRSVDTSSPLQPCPAVDSDEDFFNAGSPKQPAEASRELDASAIRHSSPSYLDHSSDLARATWKQRVYSEIDASLSSSTSTVPSHTGRRSLQSLQARARARKGSASPARKTSAQKQKRTSKEKTEWEIVLNSKNQFYDSAAARGNVPSNTSQLDSSEHHGLRLINHEDGIDGKGGLPAASPALVAWRKRKGLNFESADSIARAFDSRGMNNREPSSFSCFMDGAENRESLQKSIEESNHSSSRSSMNASGQEQESRLDVIPAHDSTQHSEGTAESNCTNSRARPSTGTATCNNGEHSGWRSEKLEKLQVSKLDCTVRHELTMFDLCVGETLPAEEHAEFPSSDHGHDVWCKSSISTRNCMPERKVQCEGKVTEREEIKNVIRVHSANQKCSPVGSNFASSMGHALQGDHSETYYGDIEKEAQVTVGNAKRSGGSRCALEEEDCVYSASPAHTMFPRTVLSTSQARLAEWRRKKAHAGCAATSPTIRLELQAEVPATGKHVSSVWSGSPEAPSCLFTHHLMNPDTKIRGDRQARVEGAESGENGTGRALEIFSGVLPSISQRRAHPVVDGECVEPQVHKCMVEWTPTLQWENDKVSTNGAAVKGVNGDRAQGNGKVVTREMRQTREGLVKSEETKKPDEGWRQQHDLGGECSERKESERERPTVKDEGAFPTQQVENGGSAEKTRKQNQGELKVVEWDRAEKTLISTVQRSGNAMGRDAARERLSRKIDNFAAAYDSEQAMTRPGERMMEPWRDLKHNETSNARSEAAQCMMLQARRLNDSARGSDRCTAGGQTKGGQWLEGEVRIGGDLSHTGTTHPRDEHAGTAQAYAIAMHEDRLSTITKRDNKERLGSAKGAAREGGGSAEKGVQCTRGERGSESGICVLPLQTLAGASSRSVVEGGTGSKISRQHQLQSMFATLSTSNKEALLDPGSFLSSPSAPKGGGDSHVQNAFTRSCGPLTRNDAHEVKRETPVVHSNTLDISGIESSPVRQALPFANTYETDMYTRQIQQIESPPKHGLTSTMLGRPATPTSNEQACRLQPNAEHAGVWMAEDLSLHLVNFVNVRTQFSGTPIRQRTIQRIPSLSPRAGAWNADKEKIKGKDSVAKLQGGRDGVSEARDKNAVKSEAIRGRTNSSCPQMSTPMSTRTRPAAGVLDTQGHTRKGCGTDPDSICEESRRGTGRKEGRSVMACVWVAFVVSSFALNVGVAIFCISTQPDVVSGLVQVLNRARQAVTPLLDSLLELPDTLRQSCRTSMSQLLVLLPQA